MNTDFINLVVEIAVTVYVFLLGLPMLVNQILLPDDIRRISKKNYTSSEYWKLGCLTTLLILIVLIALYASNCQPEFIPKDSFHAFVHPFLTYKSYLITGLFISMLALTLFFLFDNLVKSQGYRGKVVDFIKKRIIKQYKINRQVDPAYLNDLEYMGIYSKSGVETKIIIEALEDLLTQMNVQGKEAFDSYGLIAIIDTLCISVVNSIESGSRTNMIDVLNIYKGVLMNLNNFSDDENQLIHGNATRKIKDCTTKIALHSLKRDYSDMMPLVLAVITLIPRSSDKLFDIGLLAFERGQFQIATNVLSEFMDRDNHDYLTMNNYLGLIAHFYFAGHSARQCATNSLERNGVQFTKQQLKAAKEYHYIMSNFQTADKILLLQSEYFPKGK